jgi:hypothetical protein
MPVSITHYVVILQQPILECVKKIVSRICGRGSIDVGDLHIVEYAIYNAIGNCTYYRRARFQIIAYKLLLYATSVFIQEFRKWPPDVYM